MEESRALAKLLDAADLISMIEDLAQSSNMARVSEGSLAGLRLTLRSIRENILSGHGTLSEEFLARKCTPGSVRNEPPQAVMAPKESGTVGAGSSPPMTRRDLRTSLEKLVERSQQ